MCIRDSTHTHTHIHATRPTELLLILLLQRLLLLLVLPPIPQRKLISSVCWGPRRNSYGFAQNSYSCRRHAFVVRRRRYVFIRRCLTRVIIAHVRACVRSPVSWQTGCPSCRQLPLQLLTGVPAVIATTNVTRSRSGSQPPAQSESNRRKQFS